MDTFNTKNPKIVASQKAPRPKNDTNFSEDSGIKKDLPWTKLTPKKPKIVAPTKLPCTKLNEHHKIRRWRFHIYLHWIKFPEDSGIKNLNRAASTPKIEDDNINV